MRTFQIIVIILLIFYGIFAITVKPSNDRDWSLDNAILPYAEFNEDTVTIRNVRNFEYETVLDYIPRYYDKTYDLNKIKSVDFINEPFSGLAAHTFLSFGFENGDYVSISVEVRREKEEFYDIFKGAMRRFELMYVVADEKDVLRLRTNHRRDDVYLYPIKVPKNKARELFVDMLKKVNKLDKEPEFYHTLTNNCTTNIVNHVNNIAEEEAKIDFTLRYVLPRFSDRLAYDLGLIDAEGSFEEIQERFNVTEIAQKHNDDPNFSQKIREDLYN